jgi:hypothetical protein
MHSCQGNGIVSSIVHVLGHKGNLNKLENIERHTENITLNAERLNAFPLRSGTRQRCLLLPFLCSLVLEVIARLIRQEKETRHSN